MSEYIKREDVLNLIALYQDAENGVLISNSNYEKACKMIESLPSIEIEDDSIILSAKAYSHLCLSAAGRTKLNTCGTCKWRCGRKTSVGIECMQPDNQKKWQAKDTSHRECVARYKTAGTTCKRYERKDQEDEED